MAPNEWTEEEPTPALRWAVQGDQRILQQRWHVKKFQQVIEVTRVIGLHGEWRDVPCDPMFSSSEQLMEKK